jgi:hypothetical protein
MMLLRPEGLFPNRRRQLELHEATDDIADIPPPTAALGD